jgi:hypothetical protein
MFDAPHAGTGFNQGTLPWDINPDGTTTGWYVDSADVNHGFVRNKHGVIVEFDVPGNFGPWGAISSNGVVTGVYFDANNVIHGFVRGAGHGLGLAEF